MIARNTERRRERHRSDRRAGTGSAGVHRERSGAGRTRPLGDRRLRLQHPAACPASRRVCRDRHRRVLPGSGQERHASVRFGHPVRRRPSGRSDWRSESRPPPGATLRRCSPRCRNSSNDAEPPIGERLPDSTRSSSRATIWTNRSRTPFGESWTATSSFRRKLAHRYHYPAIDVLQSVSRLSTIVADRLAQESGRPHQTAHGGLRGCRGPDQRGSLC